ncbi:MAG: SAM-dependent methyltransferase [Clostridia bacterium]|nr:SAM-dependent methyltransferase [Clostridia bacterium]
MLNLGERMLMAAKMVRHGSVVADIGTDHAYLPAYLVLNGISPSALACDLRKGPIDNARKTIEHYGIADKITLRLSDGFDSIEPFEAQDFVICGMGGTLMKELVSRAYWLKDKTKRIIVQPQSHAEDIRQFFIENGFSIISEDACIDAGKLYCAMAAEYTGEKQEKHPAYAYTGKLPECRKPEAKLYLLKVADRLKIKLKAEEEHGCSEKAENIKTILSETERIINEM